MTSPAVPVGGSTGLSHEHSAAVEEAAAWLVTTAERDRPQPLVPFLRGAFSLSPMEACEAIKIAGEVS